MIFFLMICLSCSIIRGTNNKPIDFQVLENIYEAEDAQIVGCWVRNSGFTDNFSGSGFVGNFSTSRSSVTFTVIIPEDGFYNIIVSSGTQTNFGNSINIIYANNVEAGSITSLANDKFNEGKISRVHLKRGENNIKFEALGGWCFLDYIRLEAADDMTDKVMNFDRYLSNSNANDDVKRLWSFLVSSYGKKVISGQQANELSGHEMQTIKNVTGTYPAIMGFDFMDYSSSRVEIWGGDGKSVDYAVEWANEGGIITFSWHWNAPKKYLIEQHNEPSTLPNSQRWWSGFYKSAVNDSFDLEKIMIGEDPQGFELLIKDIDIVSMQLKRLQDLGIAVLWRPLHEASGGWFWWGAYGAQACKSLYILLYERMTFHHGLNNLIWVWNSEGKDWFPGVEYVDIVSVDYYADARNYNSLHHKFYYIVDELLEIGTMKIIALSENGPIPDIDNMVRDNAMWSYWCTWVGEFVDNTERSQLLKMYNNDLVITLRNLPD
jgi:mannan endo-1,4-beta-mannosidase